MHLLLLFNFSVVTVVFTTTASNQTFNLQLFQFGCGISKKKYTNTSDMVVYWLLVGANRFRTWTPTIAGCINDRRIYTVYICFV